MLRFIDGFDHYATAQITNKWAGGGSGLAISSTYGRFGNGIGGGAVSIFKTIDLQDVWVVGFAVKVTSIFERALVSLRGSTTTQVQLFMNGSGNLAVRRRAGGELGAATLGTGTAVLSINAWYFVELKVYIHDTSGTVDVRINEVSDLALTSQDTKYSATAGADNIIFFPTGTCYMDDIYICDDQGSNNNNFLGDCRVETLFPNANGSSVEFTPSGGSNWECVDETTPDGDTSYNESETVGHKDLLGCTNLVTSAGSVFGVQANLWADKDDAGGREIQPLTLSNAVEAAGSSHGLSTSYTYYADIFETEPDSGALWTVDEVNAAEFGYEVSA